MSLLSPQLQEFHSHLLRANKIVALVGAGLSASLGLATYRGTQGLWKNYNMIDLATPDAFYIDPGLVWQFYLWRRYQALKASPNRGHQALAALSKVDNLQFITINQNVDGLLTRAGHSNRNQYQIHGSLFKLKCTSFSCNYVDNDNFDHPLTPALKGTEFEYQGNPTRKRRLSHNSQTPQSQEQLPQFAPVAQLNEDQLPQCPRCSLLLRPGVVWFGELLSVHQIHAIDSFIEDGDPPDLVLVIGTSGTVYPANSYVDRVRYHGGKVAVFNTDIDEPIVKGDVKDTWGFVGDAADTLPQALAPLVGEVSDVDTDELGTTDSQKPSVDGATEDGAKSHS